MRWEEKRPALLSKARQRTAVWPCLVSVADANHHPTQTSEGLLQQEQQGKLG